MKRLRSMFSSNTQDCGPNLRDRDGHCAKRLVEAGAVLLDVRSPAEFASGHITGALNIPHTDLPGRIDELRKAQGGDPGTAVVIYCKSGGRAGMAKRYLLSQGYGSVMNLGGLHDWPTTA